MEYTKAQALKSLDPTAKWMWEGEEYSGITWDASNSKAQPTESEIDAEITRLQGLEAMKLLRERRTNLLAQSDWRANSDVTMSDEWKTYRQQLRDITKTANPKLNDDYTLDISSVTLPTKPE